MMRSLLIDRSFHIEKKNGVKLVNINYACRIISSRVRNLKVFDPVLI